MHYKAMVSISIFIVALSVAYYFVYYLPKQAQDKAIQEQKQQELLRAQELSNRLALDACLQKAEKEFYDTFKINSYLDPRPGYPDARTWTDSYIKDSVTKKLEDDKGLCIKLYAK